MPPVQNNQPPQPQPQYPQPPQPQPQPQYPQQPQPQPQPQYPQQPQPQQMTGQLPQGAIYQAEGWFSSGERFVAPKKAMTTIYPGLLIVTDISTSQELWRVEVKPGTRASQVIYVVRFSELNGQKIGLFSMQPSIQFLNPIIQYILTFLLVVVNLFKVPVLMLIVLPLIASQYKTYKKAGEITKYLNQG